MITSPFLLASDMDGTLLPNSNHPYDASAYDRFRELVSVSDFLTLAYISGRHLELAEKGIAEFSVPTPHYFVGDVGTSLYKREADIWIKSHEWFEEIAPDFNGNTGKEVLSWFEAIDGISPQETEKQGDFKTSFYYELDQDVSKIQEQIRVIIEQKGGNMVVVPSIDHVKNIGLIDILPASATKEHALRFLVNLLGIPNDSVLYCGDTGKRYSPSHLWFSSSTGGKCKRRIARRSSRSSEKTRNTRDRLLCQKTLCRRDIRGNGTLRENIVWRSLLPVLFSCDEYSLFFADELKNGLILDLMK
jgi:HAD superfamily hydrolase (TIGR01484 family)